MSFKDIFDKLSNHSYIRRERWSPNVYIQLRKNVQLLRLVFINNGKINVLDNDIRINTSDLFENDWISNEFNDIYVN